ncbi:hypothetical protein AB0E69_28535 [Kribbella sp. NPDC026611]|uniref:hypothetical protein n=1 Tax=Kribbella sp. NPDC026611 TaxID=3154911 RepID=UPI0033FCE447
MDPIDEFVRLFVQWMDRSGAEGNPDLALIRDLLEARRPVQDVFGLRDDMGQGVPGVMVWPNTSLYRTVIEVAPFSFPVDAPVREALVRTVPLLAAFIRMSLTTEREDTLRKEAEDVVDVLTTSNAGNVMERPATWALRLRKYWLRTEAKFDPPPGADGEGWSARFGRLPWERRNELVGPILRPALELPAKPYGDAVVPRPTISLPSTLATAARTASLMAEVIEVAEFLADRTGAWSGGRLGEDVVQQVLDGTSLSDPQAVQDAWRLAVLAGFLWPVPIRVFRGEKLDQWSEPEHVVEIWTDVVSTALFDVSDPARGELVKLVFDLYHPGPAAALERLAAVRASAEGAAGLDRLVRLGLVAPTAGGGVELTPLGIQGLLFRWINVKSDGGWQLVAGDWRPDLTAADLVTWLRAISRGQIADKAGADWPRAADPQVFAGQLVDAMLATDDGVIRSLGSMYLSRLGTSVLPKIDRLAGTPLHAYRAMWSAGEAVREPSVEELMLWTTDYLAFNEVWQEVLTRLEAGTQVDLGNFDLPLPAGDPLLAKATAGGALTAAEVAEMRTRFAEDRAYFLKFKNDLAAHVTTESPTDR